MSTPRRAFSLIELLVVIFIIIVIVAITVPGLAAARRAARKAETQTLLNTLSSAVVSFQNVEKREPGYFTARDMGHNDNVTRGFSAMQNVMLDLAGGVVASTTPTSTTVRDVGPKTTAAGQVRINIDNIGLATGTNKLYFTPNKKNMVTQDGSQGGARLATTAEHVYPELVDAFGTPILAWVEDTAYRKTIATANDVARIDAGTDAAPTPSRFYWASNSAFFTNGIRVGKRGVDNGDLSMLGDQVTPADRINSLIALVGNPGSSINVAQSAPVVALEDVMPSAARGSVIFHSAGEDAAFLPKKEGSSPTVKDAGMAQGHASGSTFHLDFGLNFRALDNSPLTNSTDIVKKFNDIVQASGS